MRFTGRLRSDPRRLVEERRKRQRPALDDRLGGRPDDDTLMPTARALWWHSGGHDACPSRHAKQKGTALSGKKHETDRPQADPRARTETLGRSEWPTRHSCLHRTDHGEGVLSKAVDGGSRGVNYDLCMGQRNRMGEWNRIHRSAAEWRGRARGATRNMVMVVAGWAAGPPATGRHFVGHWACVPAAVL